MRDMEKKSTGFTLIEMLVGIVIGMIVVAAASVMMVSVLKSQKDITASARLNQELGAAMVVMSNEIRRAGFSVCDMKKMHDATPPLACPDNAVEDEVPYITYALGDDLKVGDVDGGGNDDGDCILYRYNADVDRYGHDATDTDAEVDYLSEHRGFRFVVSGGVGVIQIAQSDKTKDVKCDEDDRWVPFTNPRVIDITGLSFSTTGSKCRNMTLPDPQPSPEIVAQYWIVEEDPDSGETQTGLACDNGAGSTSPGATTPVNYCTVTVDPTDPTTCVSGQTVDTSIVNTGDKLFGTRQIIITLNARLTRDQTVSKILTTSVKVANPQIEIAQ